MRLFACLGTYVLRILNRAKGFYTDQMVPVAAGDQQLSADTLRNAGDGD